MLILSRKIGEELYIGNDVSVSILGVKAGQVKIGIKAPSTVEINREELYRKKYGKTHPASVPRPDRMNAILEQAEMK